jgi:hypothetical protein
MSAQRCRPEGLNEGLSIGLSEGLSEGLIEGVLTVLASSSLPDPLPAVVERSQSENMFDSFRRLCRVAS